MSPEWRCANRIRDLLIEVFTSLNHVPTMHGKERIVIQYENEISGSWYLAVQRNENGRISHVEIQTSMAEDHLAEECIEEEEEIDEEIAWLAENVRVLKAGCLARSCQKSSRRFPNRGMDKREHYCQVRKCDRNGICAAASLEFDCCSSKGEVDLKVSG